MTASQIVLFRISAVLLGVSVALLAPTGAVHSATPRIALVIGNADYVSVKDLRNARNDARLMTDTLTSIGFTVLGGFDLDKSAMRETIRRFEDELSRAPDGTVALFYYAGHGVQLRGDNYLLATDSHIMRSDAIPEEAISAIGLLKAMAGANRGLNILILDACRDNPFIGGDRELLATGAGLTPIEAVNGAYIAYATAPGFVAYDGAGENSPFSGALADYLRLPGLTVESVMKLVGSRVRSETGGKQTPWTTSSLTAEFVPLRPQLDKFERVETRVMDESHSYSLTYKVLDDMLLVCGGTAIAGAKGEVFSRPVESKEVRNFLTRDHYVAFYTETNFGIPYFCELYCPADKGAYCRDIEVVKALWSPEQEQRLKVLEEQERGQAHSVEPDIDSSRIPVIEFPETK